MSEEEVDAHILVKYDIQQKLGKGVRVVGRIAIAFSMRMRSALLAELPNLT